MHRPGRPYSNINFPPLAKNLKEENMPTAIYGVYELLCRHCCDSLACLAEEEDEKEEKEEEEEEATQTWCRERRHSNKRRELKIPSGFK